MAAQTTRKTKHKKPARKAAGRAQGAGQPIGLRKLMDNLEAVEPSGVSPCRAALRRIKRCLSVQDTLRLKADLAVLEQAVSACPRDCGCRRGLKHVVIHAEGKVLGELTSEDGVFSGLFLNGAGEELLGDEIARMRYVGIGGAPGFHEPVQVRDPEFLAAFVGWCGLRGCGTLVLAEPYLPVWSRLQTARLDELSALRIMEKLQSIPPGDAWRLVENLDTSSATEVC